MWPFRRKRQDQALFNMGDIWSGRPNTSSGVRVNADYSTTLGGCLVVRPPVGRCRLGTAGACLRRRPSPSRPARALVTPAAGTDLPDWLWQHMISYLLRGNAMGIIADRATVTRPSQIELINPDRVTVQVTPDGTVAPRRPRDRPSRAVASPRLSAARRTARPVPDRLLRCTVGLGLAVEDYGASFFRDATTPSGVLTSERGHQPGAGLRDSRAVEVLPQRRRDTAVLGAGIKFQPISIAPEESQFIDTMRLNITNRAHFRDSC